MKTYISAKLQIVRTNVDIVTESFTQPHNTVGDQNQLTPGRRRSIWD